MIEQINIVGAKRVRESLSAWVIEAKPSETNAEKSTSIKSMKNEHPAFFLRIDDIVNSLNYEGIAVIELCLPFDSDRLRAGSVS